MHDLVFLGESGVDICKLCDIVAFYQLEYEIRYI